MIYVIASTVGITPLRLSSSKKLNTFYIFPQGWGFFTKSPRQGALVIYSLRDGKVQKVTKPNYSSDNLFGISRKNRARQLQLAYSISKYENRWRKCATPNLLNCNKDSLIIIENVFRNPLLKGKYIIQKRTQIPWAWSKSRTSENNPYEIMAIDFK